MPFVSNAQLKKTAEIEKVRTFTTGTVTLLKTTIEDVELYAVSLPNNSKYYNNVVLWLGNKEEMLTNLNAFSETLGNGKKGEVFEFTSCGYEYTFSYRTVFGQRCFKVSEPFSTSQDFGNLYKTTVDDIIKYFDNIDKKERSQE